MPKHLELRPVSKDANQDLYRDLFAQNYVMDLAHAKGGTVKTYELEAKETAQAIFPGDAATSLSAAFDDKKEI